MLRSDLFIELPASRGATVIIDRPISGRRDDPSRRIGRDTIPTLPVGRHDEGVLDGVLSPRDVAEKSDQGRYCFAVDVAEYELDGVHPRV